MHRHQHASGQDRPIDSEADDRLDRGSFVESLIRALIVDELNDERERVGHQSTGYVVGPTGRWGLGKSSVLNLVAQRLASMDDVIVALFNPWLFSGRDELVAGFFNAMRDAMGQSKLERARQLLESLDRYREAINAAGRVTAAAIDLHGGSGIASTGWKTWWSRVRGFLVKPKPRTPADERRALEAKIAKAQCAIVVLIDELDRVEDDEVRAVAQLVKAVGDISGVSYLVAYDPDRVIHALGRGERDERRKSGERYLEKIIQHPIPLRPLFTEDTKALLEAALIDHDVTLASPSGGQQQLFDHLIGAIETPREVKRLVGAFSVLGRAVRGEICPYGVLGYCWVLTKSPAVRDLIAAHVDDLVDDPNEKSMVARAVRRINKEVEPDIIGVLGETAIIQKKTLELLFPRFTDESGGGDWDRLSRRRNLVRMLYLGNPPGIIPRREVEKLWSNPNLPELETAVRRLLREKTLASVVDRVDDLLPSLPEIGDRTFWVALSRAFYRRSDWLHGPEAARARADDAATALYHLGLRHPTGVPRLRAAIDALTADGDLILVPWVVRKHLFAHGLTTHSEVPRGGEIFDLRETKELLACELPRYRAAVLEGVALRRLPNTEAVHVIINSGHWDDDLRASFTGQLDGLEALSTLAALLVPRGYAANRASLDELFDADIVQQRIETLVMHGALPAEPWLAESLQRLRAILARRDPDFDTDDIMN